MHDVAVSIDVVSGESTDPGALTSGVGNGQEVLEREAEFERREHDQKHDRHHE